MNLLLVFNQLNIDQQVSLAAENLGMTQPAVSNTLKRLRTLMNDELFVRTGRGMQPTPYAAQLAAPVAQALEILRQALTYQPGFEPADCERRFRIAMTDIGEIHLVPRLIQYLARHAPGVKISTLRSSAELSSALANGEVDLAVGLLPDLETNFLQQQLFTHSYVCLCRTGHPLAEGVMSTERYSSYGHVRIVAANTGHNEVDLHLERAGVQRNVHLEVPYFAAVGHILQRTDLIATLPELYAANSAELFGLAILPPPLPLPEITINMFWHARSHSDPSHRWLRELIVELFGGS